MAKRPTTTAPNPEREAEKSANFKRLASKRTSAAIEEIRGLVPLSNKSAYTYTEAEVTAIATALRNEVDALVTAFSGSKSGGAFKL